ncbi:MAG: PAS domain-containing protein [Candidatus Riflebacteria bacterium]|nr:PAS domain-containing protein [Candidatus Riflebacteria bacterium]
MENNTNSVMENSPKLVLDFQNILKTISHAISTMVPDRALNFLVETALKLFDCKGALLLTPHDKLKEMVPLIENLPSDRDKNLWENVFPSSCYQVCNKIFLEGHTFSFDPEGIKELKPEFSTEIGNALALPVILSGKAIGLLFIFRSPDSQPFSPETQSFLELLAPFMGPMMENVLLHNEMIHKNSRLSALYEISQRTESLVDLRDVYISLEEVIRSFINFDALGLYLLDHDNQTLEIRNHKSVSPFPPKVKLGDPPLGQAAKEKKPYLTFTDKYKSVLILPMEVSGALIGVVAIGSQKSYAYRDEDIIGLRIITTQLASIDVLFKDLLKLRGFTQHILQSMTTGVLIFDNNGKVNFSNQVFSQILGNKLLEGISIDKDGEIFPETLKKMILEVLESKLAIENEKIKITEDSGFKILEVNAFPFRDESGVMLGTAFFTKDITQIVRLEEQLKRADRLSALGVLAAGIAHEIRNPLTGIKMIVQLLNSEIGTGDPKHEPLKIIQNEIERLERIIVNLLDFAKPSKPQAFEFSLRDILNGCLMLLQNQMSKMRIHLQTDYPDEIPILIGDSNQLKQVFLNILTNAIHASHPGGIIAIKVETSSNCVITSIRDSGIGIKSELLRAIFDPFVTTKEDGTGLGLSVALRIVEEHSGRIEVESAPAQGSTFSVFLPLNTKEN